MSFCNTLTRASLTTFECGILRNYGHFPVHPLWQRPSNSISTHLNMPIPFVGRGRGLQCGLYQSNCYSSAASEAVAIEPSCSISEPVIIDISEDLTRDTVERLLSPQSNDAVSRLMKMERKSVRHSSERGAAGWFPYMNKFKAGNFFLSSAEVLEALDPHIMDARKDRFRNAVKNRSYSVCLVVEGLCDLGNVSAAFRSADALGFQSVHVVSCDSSKRYRDNRHVSKGAEKWLDIEVWDSTRECFDVLKSCGYRIATTCLGTNAVSIYDMDWTCPTAIVVGNENRGISVEALELSDLRCSIPMRGMVDSFNVSVAAGVLMHHAVCDRTFRLGSHGDLSTEESQILLAEFFLRHSKSAISIAHEYAKRKATHPATKL